MVSQVLTTVVIFLQRQVAWEFRTAHDVSMEGEEAPSKDEQVKPASFHRLSSYIT